MENSDKDIFDYQARGLIRKLVAFLGVTNTEKALKKYELSLSSAGPIYRDYYIKTRHPWFEAFKQFFELEKAGKSIKNHFDLRLKRLTGDSKIISILQKAMPEKVKNKFKKDLLDENRAFDYLFEIYIAWHYHLKGYEIQWYEDDNSPEFLVKTPGLDFNVECKRISSDIARKIWRRDFYRFAEILIEGLEKEKVQGSIDIELNDKLKHSNEYLNTLSSQIIDIIRQYSKGRSTIPLGEITLNLRAKDGMAIDLKKHHANLMKRKPREAHGVIFTNSKNSKPVDPLELTILSKKNDEVLNGIKNKIQDASSKQLPKSMPGIIACFLEDISAIELQELASNSGLQKISNYILSLLSHLFLR